MVYAKLTKKNTKTVNVNLFGRHNNSKKSKFSNVFFFVVGNAVTWLNLASSQAKPKLRETNMSNGHNRLGNPNARR